MTTALYLNFYITLIDRWVSLQVTLSNQAAFSPPERHPHVGLARQRQDCQNGVGQSYHNASSETYRWHHCLSWKHKTKDLRWDGRDITFMHILGLELHFDADRALHHTLTIYLLFIFFSLKLVNLMSWETDLLVHLSRACWITTSSSTTTGALNSNGEFNILYYNRADLETVLTL